MTETINYFLFCLIIWMVKRVCYKKMSRNLFACRGCLATDTKLYDLYEKQLLDVFRDVVGSPFQDIESDSLPSYICSCCKALLLKYTTFRSRCRRAQQVLEEVEFHGGQLTTDFIASIDRPYYGLNMNLTTSNPVTMDSEDVDNETEVEYINSCTEDKPFVKLVFFEESEQNDENVLHNVCDEYVIEDLDNNDPEFENMNPEVVERANVDEVNCNAPEFWCTYCGESFLNDVGLRNHKKKTHFDVPMREFLCDTCEVPFLNAEALREHCSGLCTPNPCVHCGMSFESELYLKFHILHVHRKVKRNMLKCDACYTEFVSARALSTHLSLTHSTCRGLSSCVQCGKSFITPGLMKKHVADKHEGKEFVCQKCGKTFPTVHTYGKHYELIHMKHKNRRPTRLTGPKKWGVVSVAGATLIAGCSGEDDRSDEADREDGSVVCEFCGKICMNSSLLEYHQLIHTREKPYKCVICQKGFTTPILLKQHIRVHTGERPHKCEYCPKMFKSRSALNRHTLIHTGERNHICQLCGKAFITSTNVKTHIKTVHMKIPLPPRDRSRRLYVQ
ncbi:unnamed protein product [Chilo suppressalis]|uniref:Uncharacterized protein n=1 Tax=Chilo suppressalis TaxID=168631 RepID=A0ABN8L9X0_CHISP|nr:unnamed protein product [Chilo suppressalis]